MKQFHTVAKIQRHLKTSKSCRARLRPSRNLQAPLPGIGSRGDRLLQEQHDDLLPTLQASGPALPARVVQPSNADGSLHERLILGLFPEQPILDRATLRQTLVDIILGTAVAWTAMAGTVSEIGQELSPEDGRLIGWDIEEIKGILGDLTSPASWTFFQCSGPGEADSAPRETTEWTQLMGETDVALDSTFTSSSARPFSAHRIILHLFAGPRRHGDFQEFLDKIPPKDGTVIHTISIDLIYHAEWGNLAKRETQLYWLHCIRQGWVMGMLAGPPCCTWSQARGRPVPGRTYFPRILRTARDLWGILLLAIRELLQVMDGDVLLFFCHEALLELWCVRAAGMLEHPATPEDEDRASIWRTAPVRLLRQLKGFELVVISQGFFGSKSPKPTQVLCLNLPGMGRTLQDSRLSAVLPQGNNIGTDLSGHWQTTGLKEYPPGLNLCFAEAFRQFANAAPIRQQLIPRQFWERTRTMKAELTQTLVQDFQR